jgi:hypothetical protein
MANLRGSLLAVAIGLAVLVPMVHADSLEMKDGNMVQGKYLGGSDRAVQFEVNGKVQIYEINQILSISFAALPADGGIPSNSAAPKASAKAEQGPASPVCGANANAGATQSDFFGTTRFALFTEKLEALPN